MGPVCCRFLIKWDRRGSCTCFLIQLQLLCSAALAAAHASLNRSSCASAAPTWRHCPALSCRATASITHMHACAVTCVAVAVPSTPGRRALSTPSQRPCPLGSNATRGSPRDYHRLPRHELSQRVHAGQSNGAHGPRRHLPKPWCNARLCHAHACALRSVPWHGPREHAISPDAGQACHSSCVHFASFLITSCKAFSFLVLRHSNLLPSLEAIFGRQTSFHLCIDPCLQVQIHA